MKLSPFADNPDMTGLQNSIIDLMYRYTQRNVSKEDRFAPSLDFEFFHDTTAKESGYREIDFANNTCIDSE